MRDQFERVQLKTIFGVVAALIAGGWLQADPGVCAVSNSAFVSSFTPGTLSPVCAGDSSVAPGSLIIVAGDGLGPVIEEHSAAFPLRTTLSGTSVRLAVAGTDVDAFLLSAQKNRIEAMVPSKTPVGDGVLVVTHNGIAGAPHKIQVVDRDFQIYVHSPLSIAQNVSADGTVQSNTFSEPVKPGQLLILWGTGLGAVPGDEASGPVPSSASGMGIEVMLGLQRARVLYAGRSGCCAGLDQIVIETPAGIEGCSVPAVVRPLPANFGGSCPTVAVASRGGCSDPHGMPEVVRQQFAAKGGGKIGRIVLGSYGWSPDGVSAYFTRFGNSYTIPAGTCGYPPPSGSLSGSSDSFYWDAGPELNLSGNSVKLMVPQDLDDFNSALGSFYQRAFTTSDLLVGAYTIDNGNGGPDIAPFRFDFQIDGPSFEWTNRSALTAQIGQDLNLTWTAGTSAEGYVMLQGTFLTFETDPNGYGLGGFQCLERTDKGRFTVPGWLISKGGAEVLDVQIQPFKRQELRAPGLDFGEFLQVSKPEFQRLTFTN